MPANTTTARGSVDKWVAQLDQLFDVIAKGAASAGWVAARSTMDSKEDPFSLGASIQYGTPVLTLKRPASQGGTEQRITFEPRHRFTIGAAGRIDVYAYPCLREAMLRRIPDTVGIDNLTWDEAEIRVADAPWRAFSDERLPLKADIGDTHSLVQFLEDLVA